MNHPLVISLLLTGAVVVTLSCSLALVVMGSPLARLHYLGPASLLAPWLVTAAVLVEEGFSQAGLKPLWWRSCLASKVQSSLMFSAARLPFAKVRNWELEGHGPEIL